MKHLFTNSLINEMGPYLLQHAHNPVNWFAWYDAALEKAKKKTIYRDVLSLGSINSMAT